MGRIAFALHDRVDVQPVHYVMDREWLYVRTSAGIKAGVLRRNPWIAFEVDEVESMFLWRSVVVRGTVYVLSPDSTPDLATRYIRAVRKLRALLPETLSPADPVAFRNLVLGIYVRELTGREAIQPRPRRR